MGGISGNYSQSNTKGSKSGTENTQGSGTSRNDGGSERSPWQLQGDNIREAWKAAWNNYANNSTNSSAGAAATDWNKWQQGQKAKVDAQTDELTAGWKGQRDREDKQYGQWQDVLSDFQKGIGSQQEWAGNFAANDPYLNKSVDSMWDNTDRLLQDQVGGTSGIDHRAAASGNMSSSRAGVAEGTARSDATRYGQESELGMRSDAYKTGLDQHAQMQGQFASLADKFKTDGQGDMLRGQSDSYTSGQGRANDLYANQFGLGQAADSRQWDNLNNLWNIIGGNNWGSSSSEWGDSDETMEETKQTKEKSRTKNSGFSFGGRLGS